VCQLGPKVMVIIEERREGDGLVYYLHGGRALVCMRACRFHSPYHTCLVNATAKRW
jgi:hypothetical protein